MWQLFDNGVYILSVKESKSRCVNSVDLYYKTPTAAKQAFKRYWGANIPDKAKWVVDVLNSTPNPDECDATKADKR